MYTIFELAILEVKREGKINGKNLGQLIIDRAYTIRKWLDLSDRNTKVANNRKLRISKVRFGL